MINKMKHMAWVKDNADSTLSYRLPAKRRFLILIMIIGILSTSFGPFAPQEVAADTAGEQRRRIEELENRLQQQEKQLKDTREQLEAVKKSMDAQQPKEEQAKARTKTPTKEVIKEILGTMTMDYRGPTPEEKRLETIYDDGFYLRGMDDTIKIGGWYQFDGRLYLNEGYPIADTFTNRRARLDVRGVLENDWGYRLYATFIGSPVIKEAWLEYQHFPFARLKLGQFKEPFSLESQYSSRWIDFVERSMGVTALQPGEDIGVMVFGNFWDSRVVYGIGAFNGQGIDEDAVVDDKDVTGRVAVQPFRQQKKSLFEKLYIGGSLS